jgi:outer membrane protein assembly factor BamD
MRNFAQLKTMKTNLATRVAAAPEGRAALKRTPTATTLKTGAETLKALAATAKRTLAAAALVATVAGFVSCGAYNKVLKSADAELIYQTALRMYRQKKSDKAITLFETVDNYYRGTAREDTVKFFLAKSYFDRRDYFTSNEQLNQFRRQFQRVSPFIEEAEYLVAMGYYLSSPEPELDQNPTKLAIVEFTQYLARYPNSVKSGEIADYLGELQGKLYKKSYLNAKVYHTISSYLAAIRAFRNAIAEYPESPYREEMMFLLTESCFTYAENSIETQQRSRYLDMIDAYLDLIQNFPDGRYAAEARKMFDKAQSVLASRYGETVERPAEEVENNQQAQ